MRRQSIGEQELAVLRHVAERGSATVGEVAEEFGGARGLARSTVLTMMERLRKKGYLTRRLTAGLYRYQPRTSPAEAMRQAIGQFVERNLDGSVSPFVAYLGESAHLTDAELKELEAVVARLQSERQKERR